MSWLIVEESAAATGPSAATRLTTADVHAIWAAGAPADAAGRDKLTAGMAPGTRAPGRRSCPGSALRPRSAQVPETPMAIRAPADAARLSAARMWSTTTTVAVQQNELGRAPSLIRVCRDLPEPC